MEDLAGKINSILNDPQAMQQVSALAGMLGNGNAQPPPAPQPEPQGQNNGLANLGNLNALASLLGGQTQQTQQAQPANQMNSEMMQTVLQIMPMLSTFQQEDDSTRLLQSLRPLLSRERQKKLDEASKIMKVFRLLPLLKSKGIL